MWGKVDAETTFFVAIGVWFVIFCVLMGIFGRVWPFPTFWFVLCVVGFISTIRHIPRGFYASIYLFNRRVGADFRDTWVSSILPPPWGRVHVGVVGEYSTALEQLKHYTPEESKQPAPVTRLVVPKSSLPADVERLRSLLEKKGD